MPHLYGVGEILPFAAWALYADFVQKVQIF